MAEISLYEIIRNEKYDRDKGENVEILDNETRNKLFTEIKSWVAGTARGKRRGRIWRCPISGVDLCGILNRLVIDTETLKVEYIAGQDYPSEMYTIRDCFD